MGEVLVRTSGYTVAARYLDNSEEMVRERYSHIEAGELGDVFRDGGVLHADLSSPESTDG